MKIYLIGAFIFLAFISLFSCDKDNFLINEPKKPDTSWEETHEKSISSIDGEIYWEERNYYLVCNESGKVIAEIKKYKKEPFSVYGGDGNGYGDYLSLLSAKEKAESLYMFSDTGKQGCSLLTCP